MLRLITRAPAMSGQGLEYRYYRETELNQLAEEVQVALHPQAYRLLPDGDWIVAPALVEAACQALFARDALFARAMAALRPLLTPDDGGPYRLDIGDRVVIGMPVGGMDAEALAARGQDVASALTAACGPEIADGGLALVWAD